MRLRKYKRMKHRGMICEKCGVEVTRQGVRANGAHQPGCARRAHLVLGSPLPSVAATGRCSTSRCATREASSISRRTTCRRRPGDDPGQARRDLTEDVPGARRRDGDEGAGMGGEAIRDCSAA